MANTNSYHHKSKRAHIPSKEEAGYEDASSKVKEGKQKLDVPKNPVVHRGHDPELFWMEKYGQDDLQDRLQVDIRSLYRHEHIAPEKLIEGLYKMVEKKKDESQMDLFSANELFGNALEYDELDKVSEYYKHSDGWSNRLIQGDSLLVMSSLLEREGMAGQVQCIYIDPPYGIKYNSNWQMKLNDRNVTDGKDEHLTGEPEMIKAYRDTWELGIHSYLSYLRDRLLVAKELLTESGSCFVQISDENVHLVRCLMDEVFGSENFVNQITFRKTLPLGAGYLPVVADYIIWYSKSKEELKYRQVFGSKPYSSYTNVELNDGSIRRLTNDEKAGNASIPKDAKMFSSSDLKSSGYTASCTFDFEYNGKLIRAQNKSWRTTKEGVNRLIELGRLLDSGNIPRYKQYYDDFPLQQIDNIWNDTQSNPNSMFVVQTATTVLRRLILMTTDPGDLVLDPTCGSGTTAYVAEQWGRRWITIDTSRIALNIAKTRLMTATFPYYHLYSDVEVQREPTKEGKIKKRIAPKTEIEQQHDIRQGFVYEEVPHITLKSLANDEPPATETLYDKPFQDKRKLRVSGPFTVETLQNFEPVNPAELEELNRDDEENQNFEQRVFEHLKSAGVKNGIRNEQAVFKRPERLTSPYLHAEGFYETQRGENKAYIHIGPKFGTVSKTAVNHAVKECRQRGDADWLIILGFSFESDIENLKQTTSMGSFEVTKVRMHDDLMQEGLMKKDKKAGSFITIGEPDVGVLSDECLVDSTGKILCNYGIFKKLSGINSLAEINKLGQDDLRKYIYFSQRRDVWVDIANAEGIRFDFSEYSRRAGQELDQGIHSVLGDSESFFGGTGDFDYFMQEPGFDEQGKRNQLIEQYSRNKQNAARIAEITAQTPLTTNHYSLVTILGLDIYDPITDQVKARNVNDIAYWMVDDDYDGSNFVVKQVFFCGGSKDEFRKWQKGLSDLSKQSSKRNAEKTLKIEIDEEAFDRLYGFRSHPIKVKEDQRIAVRVVSQFGEESMKVVEM